MSKRLTAFWADQVLRRRLNDMVTYLWKSRGRSELRRVLKTEWMFEQGLGNQNAALKDAGVGEQVIQAMTDTMRSAREDLYWRERLSYPSLAKVEKLLKQMRERAKGTLVATADATSILRKDWLMLVTMTIHAVKGDKGFDALALLLAYHAIVKSEKVAYAAASLARVSNAVR